MPVTKTWVVTSQNPRASHAEMDGETVAINMPFSNGLMYPGDSSAGDAAEVANCTCVMAIEGDSSVTETGTNPTHERRVEDFLSSTPRALTEKLENGNMIGATRQLRSTGGDLSAMGESQRAATEALDEAIAKYGHEFEGEEVLYRGVLDDTGWFTPKVGEQWHDEGFTFATMNKGTALHYADPDEGWIIQFVTKKGDRAMPYPRHQAMVLPRGQVYRIQSVNETTRTVVMVSE